MKTRLPAVVAHRDGGAGRLQHVADFGVAGFGGEVECGVSPFVARVESRAKLARLQQAVHHLRVPVTHGREEIESTHALSIPRRMDGKV